MKRERKEIENEENDLLEKIKKLSNNQKKQIDNIISGMIRFNTENS